jgi:hypothetical protein
MRDARGMCGKIICVKRFIKTEQDAVEFLKDAKFVLRYDSTPGLPLKSMYDAAADQRLAIELTNVLLARNEVVETNVIANRLVLAHRDVVPALFTLRVRFRKAALSDDALRTFRLIKKHSTLSAGDVRRSLGVSGLKRPDPADVALAELQKEMLIDRGASSVPQKGIPYLSKEGYPYRVFEDAHPEMLKAAQKLSIEDAIKVIRAAVADIPVKKFVLMFKLCLKNAEAKQLKDSEV